MMTTNPKLAACALALIVGASLSACGSGSSTPGEARPGARPGEVTATGDGAIDTAIAIDANAALEDTKIAEQYRIIAQRASEQTIKRGGTLTVLAFAGAAESSVRVLTTEVPDLAAEDELQRGEIENATRTSLEAGLSAALGLSNSAPAAVSALRQRPGSDSARALRVAIRAVHPVVRSDQTRTTRAGADIRPASVVLLTPGMHRTSDLDLTARLSEPGAASALLKRIGRADGIAIQILELGQTSAAPGVRSTDELMRTWRAACRATRASSCSVRAAT